MIVPTQEKCEVLQLQERLKQINKELAEISEDKATDIQVNLHLDFIHKEQELTHYETVLSNMLERMDDIGQIQSYESKISECQQELKDIKLKYDLHMEEIETKRLEFRHEKDKIENRLKLLET